MTWPAASTEGEQVRPHDLRHSIATDVLAAQVPMRVVQDILGHGTIAMTQRFRHVLNPILQDGGRAARAGFAGIGAAN